MVKEEIYTKQFFEMHQCWRKHYSDMADWLWRNFRPKSVIDFGCGDGFLISDLDKRGASVTGVEGSTNAVEYIPENVKKNVEIEDITKPLSFGKYDLVISSEVAEHLPEALADVFLNNLVSHSKGIIFFTAAEPRQGGTDHINDQPHEYWIGKFNRRGFMLLKGKAKAIQNYLERLWMHDEKSPWWFTRNSMVFEKKDVASVRHQYALSKIGLKLRIYILRYLVLKASKKICLPKTIRSFFR